MLLLPAPPDRKGDEIARNNRVQHSNEVVVLMDAMAVKQHQHVPRAQTHVLDIRDIKLGLLGHQGCMFVCP